MNNFNRYTFRDSDGTYFVSEADCYAEDDYYTGDAIERLAEYIKLEDAIAIIEEKQKEFCPVGRYGRGYVYGSDREKYDS